MDEQKNKIAHLSFIEDNISKMTQYCVNLKGWLVAILVGLFALTISKSIWPFYGAMLLLSVGLFLLKMWIGG